jgi:hypothetical protein
MARCRHSSPHLVVLLHVVTEVFGIAGQFSVDVMRFEVLYLVESEPIHGSVEPIIPSVEAVESAPAGTRVAQYVLEDVPLLPPSDVTRQVRQE